jgi:hypothetical protein
MGKGPKRMSAGEKASQHYRTASNKIKTIQKALEKAKGKAVEELNKRLDFWMKYK